MTSESVTTISTSGLEQAISTVSDLASVETEKTTSSTLDTEINTSSNLNIETITSSNLESQTTSKSSELTSTEAVTSSTPESETTSSPLDTETITSTYSGLSVETSFSSTQSSRVCTDQSGVHFTQKCSCTTSLSESSINSMLKELRVDITKTSAYIRKKTCAYDDRPSVKYIGSAGLSILIAVMCFLISFDMNRLYIYLRSIKSNRQKYIF